MVRLAIDKGIENIWMQPGAESPAAVSLAEQAGVETIADGSCLLWWCCTTTNTESGTRR